MIAKKLLLFSLLSISTLAEDFKVKENSGLNKLERINSIEGYMVKMESSLNSLKEELNKKEKSHNYSKIIEEITITQKKIRKDVDALKTGDISQLKKDIEFLDQEKIEKLIDKFVKHEQSTEKRIKFLEAALKDIYGQMNTFSSPNRP